jgi:hypothetical protein
MSVEGEPIESEPTESTQYEIVDKGNLVGSGERPRLEISPGQEWDFGDLEHADIEVPSGSMLSAKKGVDLQIITHPGAKVDILLEEDVRIIEKAA